MRQYLQFKPEMRKKGNLCEKLVQSSQANFLKRKEDQTKQKEEESYPIGRLIGFKMRK